MGKIDKVCITCSRGDAHLTRICVGSVRYWYPQLPIWLVKDDPASFDTREIEAVWDVKVWPTRRNRHGWGFTKLEVIAGGTAGRTLLLDSDTVMLGNVVELLEGYSEDFLVAGESFEDPNAARVAGEYYDWPKLQRYDETFQFPKWCFNTGQIVLTENKITEADFAGLLSWQEPITLAQPDIFHCADQGVLNYVLAKKGQAGIVSWRSVDFARWGNDPAISELRLENITNRTGYPFIVHWAGSKPPAIGKMHRADILAFFEDCYYSRVTNRRAKQWYRQATAKMRAGFRTMKKRLRTKRPS